LGYQIVQFKEERRIKMRKYKRAIKYADKLIQEAEKERDEKDYRENLGYELDIQLKDFLAALNLPYSQEAQVLQYFYRRCDQIAVNSVLGKFLFQTTVDREQERRPND